MNLRAFTLALVFLTRLPVRFDGIPSTDEQGRSVAMYPLVGLVIGALLLLAAMLLSWLGAPALVAAVVLVILWTAITGALHLDGLADSADAWLGGHGDRARTLTIMKDPTCGPAGVVILVLVLLLKVAALAAILELPGLPWPLLLAPVLGRSACALLFVQLPYVRPGGLGAEAAMGHEPNWLWAGAGATALATLLLAGTAGLAMMLAAGLTLWWASRLMERRLGGFTGDTAGAVVELQEAAVLLAASIALAMTA